MAVTMKQEVLAFFKALADAETSTLNYLGGLGSPPLPYASFLDGISVSQCKAFMLYRLPQNPSFNEAYASDVVFRASVINRDLKLRKMRRTDYHSEASTDIYDEITRLESSKINTIQYLTGNSVIQSAKL